MTAIYNSVLLVMIVSTMLVAGLSANAGALLRTLRNLELVGLVALCNLVVVPLIAWGLAETLSLEQPAFIALVLLGCSPGAPFASKLVLAQKGALLEGSAMQVALATLGSISFAITANLIFASTGTADIDLPVGDLIKTVAALQLIPFGLGLILNTWSPDMASEWKPYALKASALSFPAVLVLALLGSWQQIVDLLGSDALIAGALFSLLATGAGMILSPSPMLMRTTMGVLAPMRNAGPVMAAIGVAFENDPAILGATTAISLVALVVTICLNAYIARSRGAEAVAAGTDTGAADATPAATLVPPRPGDAQHAA